MPIKEEKIIVKWSPSVKKWYEDKGYIFGGMQSELEINSKDISHNSLVKITCICENCNIETKTSPNVYFNKKKSNKQYLCRKCARILNGTPNTTTTILKTRMSFGEWLIKKYGVEAIEKYWSSINKKDPFKISYCGQIEIFMICQDCGNIKKTKTQAFVNYGFRCNKCSDGISYPNKFMFSILRQLDIDFIPEYSPKWIGLKKYDFYFKIKEKEYIIEMDGAFHNRNNPFNKNTKEKSKSIDEYKDRLANENNIQVIRVDCDCRHETRHEEIRKNIENNVNICSILDISKVNWDVCEIDASSNNLKIACDLFLSGKTIKNIMEITKLSYNTIQLYLKRGTIVGICNYDPIKETERVRNDRRKKVKCIENGIIYNSIGDCYNDIDVGRSYLYLHLKGEKENINGLHYIFIKNTLTD